MRLFIELLLVSVVLYLLWVSGGDVPWLLLGCVYVLGVVVGQRRLLKELTRIKNRVDS